MVRKLDPPSKGGTLAGEAQGSHDTSPRRPHDRRSQSKRAEVARVKAELLSLMQAGHTNEDAARMVGKSAQIIKYYRRVDQDFRESMDVIRARRSGARAAGDLSNISFEEFSEKYLHSKLFRHQYQWIDVLEGRDPRDLHPGQTWKPGDRDTIIINTPPGHAKSTTVTMNYVTYKIVTNPNFRVVIISKTEAMAKKFLAGIKRRLTGNAFAQLQIDFAPPEGFERSAETWSSKMIYFGHSDTDQKDPTIEVLGIGNQIYGARADLIILDDVADTHNAHQYEAHLDYIMQDVMTRDAPLLVVGTRVAPVDIYSELMNPEHYDGEESDWTYLTQPAVLEYADDPEDWVTLWPRSDQPHAIHPGVQDENGLWPKWDGPRLAKLRKKIKPSTWALVYQQEPVNEDSTFTIEAINGCQGPRMRGELPKGDRFYYVAGLDPATQAGFTAAVLLAVDRRSGKRYLIDVFNRQLRAAGLRQLIEDWTERYPINEWRVEKNAFQSFLTQDREINQFLAARGVRLREHQTGSNKRDPEWGIASMDSLFRGWRDHQALLDLPGMSQNEAYRRLKEQLITWYPDHPKTQKIDLVMALWFAELACRDVVKDMGIKQQQHMTNPFLSQNDLESQVVVNIDDYIRMQRSLA